MGMNETPSGERIHIGFFGRRNAGKSSLLNAVTGQNLAVVSDIKGTTTDPVQKTMEILPLGPVVVIDTPGFDDEGELGALRVQKTKQVLNKTDLAVLVVDAVEGLQACDVELLELFQKKQISYITAWNKSDLADKSKKAGDKEIYVSSVTGEGIYEFKERLARLIPQGNTSMQLIGDLIHPKEIVILVTPMDESAPKGRIILPQQMMLRNILDSGAIAMMSQPDELPDMLASLKQKPAMVVTDSQAFAQAAKDTPKDIPLTSFSILMARNKGLLTEAVRGVSMISQLKDGDKVLISEGCTHHRQCGDIGSVKLPNLLRQRTQKDIQIELSSGSGFPENLESYAMIIHCGGCMLTDRDLRFRMKTAAEQQVPMTNYGIAIAYMKGILQRSIAMLPEAMEVYQS